MIESKKGWVLLILVLFAFISCESETPVPSSEHQPVADAEEQPAPSAVIDSSEPKSTAVKWVDENADFVGDLGRKIWEFAEIGLEEFKSSDLLVETLEEAGFTVERGQAGMPTAFVGTFTNGTGKPVIGFLAEYDGLPNGHSCGHNLFGAGSVSGAIAVKEAMVKQNLNGTIKLFGTPSEDTHGGKVWMVREGVFDGCDVFLSWHPGSSNKVSYGSTLAVQIMEFEFSGKSAHAGGAPEKGRDAVDALTIFSVAMEFLREHMIDSMRIQYVITNGGEAPNIVPNYAKMKLVIRGPTMDAIQELRSRFGGVDDCARAGALATGCDVKMKLVGAFYNKVPNEALARMCHENMKALDPPTFDAEEEKFVAELSEKYGIPLDGFDTSVHEPTGELGMASADTGDVTYQGPAMSFNTTCAAVGSPGHSYANVDQYGGSIGKKGTVYAAKIIACNAIDLLTNGELLEKATQEFKDRMGELEYVPVLASDWWPPIPETNPEFFKGPEPIVRPAPKEPESLLYWRKGEFKRN